MKKLLCIVILGIYTTTSLAESESVLDHWATGFNFTNNTYFFKKSNSAKTSVSLSKNLSIEKEIPSVTDDVKEIMDSQGTRIVLLSVNKKIVLEKYLKNSLKDSTPLAFSMSKSLTSLAIGQAYCAGNIKSLDDSVTTYVPRLANTSWGNSTVKQVLLMNSGSAVGNFESGWSAEHVKFQNSFIYSGWKYKDYVDDMIANDDKKFKPGEVFQYNNYDTVALGLIIEGAVKKEFVEYFHESIWALVGAEHDASWLRNRNNQAATYNGFSASPEDYIRLGHYINSLYKDPSSCMGKYLRESIKPKQQVSPTRCYGYQIWTWCDEKYGFFFVGYGGQYLIMQPQRDIVYYVHQGSQKNDAKVISLYSKMVNHLYKNNFNIANAQIFD